MTTENYSIEPLLSRELFQQWRYVASNKAASITGNDGRFDYIDYIATQAAQWGYERRGAVNEAELQKARDEELEACCADVQKLSGEDYDKYRADWLRSMRRPKPKSQAEEAIKALDSVASDLARIGEEYTGDTIRAALERLRELENDK